MLNNNIPSLNQIRKHWIKISMSLKIKGGELFLK